ncbi:2-oxoglutarate-dependent dioxygenase 19-like [Hevea brasiliensis]|uniref:2-oxoglutarate-dependent dioxygenase 19-like n=1 Tax=Hevea brasiliensis TaxID=3981 RepID=UPI0025DCDE1C|nr:2-oxoglutarate-dependent dioxygenase 19-like [Hevea brasiliensis]
MAPAPTLEDASQSILAVDDKIPAIDYFMIFSDDHTQRSIALEHLAKACDDYGFFYVEYLKAVAHPHFHCPPKPLGFSEALEEYFKRFQDVKIGLARAISKILGCEETYIEKAFKLESGFDVSAMNLYPSNLESKGSTGVASHTDPGFFVSLIQDFNGGLQVLSQNGKWINIYITRNAFLIQLGDHLEQTCPGRTGSKPEPAD